MSKFKPQTVIWESDNQTYELKVKSQSQNNLDKINFIDNQSLTANGKDTKLLLPIKEIAQ